MEKVFIVVLEEGAWEDWNFEIKYVLDNADDANKICRDLNKDHGSDCYRVLRRKITSYQKFSTWKKQKDLKEKEQDRIRKLEEKNKQIQGLESQMKMIQEKLIDLKTKDKDYFCKIF